MKYRWAHFVLLTVFLATTAIPGVVSQLSAQNSISLEPVTLTGLTSQTVNVNMVSDSPVEGFVISVAYPTLRVSVMDLSIVGTVTESAGAELVVAEIFEAQGGLTLGVVLDGTGPPFDGQTIPAPGGQIAHFDVIADSITATPGEMISLSFVDDVFNNPTLANIIVQGGLSIGVDEGLTLNDGVITLTPGPPDMLTMQNLSITNNGCASAVLDLSSGPVQGFVLAVGHDDTLVDLVDINIDGTTTESVGAEFVVPNLNPSGGVGGTLGVVLDFDPPFANQTIAAGAGIVLANFCYSCVNPVIVNEGDPVPPPMCAPLTLLDGVLGTPPLSNVIVIAGLSRNPSLNDGIVCCEPTVIVIDDSAAYYCGARDENNELSADPPKAAPGETVELCFFYTSGDSFGGGCVGDQIQGFQLALTFDCNLSFQEGTFSIADTILEAVGAEFVTHSVDNENPATDDADDDCEIIIGILLDALPPFDRQTAPPSCTPLLIGCIDVMIDETAPCSGNLPVIFTDFVDAAENVPIENIVVVGNTSVQNFPTNDCVVCVQEEREFMRGDCNFDMKVDLADASSTLAFQFQAFPVPCVDSCDANDDGFVNLADTVFLLAYIFDSGPIPPEPGPDLDKGPDPTEDELTCENGEDPCIP